MIHRKVALLAMTIALSLSCVHADETKTGNAPKPEPAPVTGDAINPAWAKPAPVADPDALGRGIQRTMRLLATSTPQKRNHVRILFYGQSITEQRWSNQVADDLRRRFPHADLEIENRAIGGFASQVLIRPAEHDVYPFNPDLVIFHVYGAHTDYEEIIKRIRSRTTAEVLLQRDHIAEGGYDPSANFENKKPGYWDNFMNNEVLPGVAKKYGTGLADVRGEWIRYLETHKLKPQALLKDGVHLNEYGCYVMAQIVGQSLVYRPELSESADKTVRDYVPAKDVKWDKNRLLLEFTGNRVELLPVAKADGGTMRVLVDGKPVSAHGECFAFTRPAPNPWASPLSLSRVDSTAPFADEDWTLKVTEVKGTDPKTATWTYSVSGSKTGADGSGKSDAAFTSPSGRVKIEPESFFRGTSPALSVGHAITWRSYLLGTDVYTVTTPADPTKENAVLLAGGLTNGKHTLELVADGAKPSAIAAIRVHQPAYGR
ncbi:MAG: SGNH/GDSL hydrolase family protein [Akkermansiaceae bacterium]|nr:SGNH/GDSL hydrolase family protein [Armatimonadota bacterium]